MRRVGACILALDLAACAGPQVRPAGSSATSSQPPAGPTSRSDEPTRPAESPAGPSPLLDERDPDPTRSLPRLSFKNVGLHVGGGTGSAEERAALLGTLEQGERKVLSCYRRVERPLAGGTFGTDLYIPASGGHPTVRALRQKLGGPDFEECMMKALETVSFGPQARPLVISYSIRFELSSS